MLSQHATRIVIEGLERAPSIILLLMFESCCALKASAEVRLVELILRYLLKKCFSVGFQILLTTHRDWSSAATSSLAILLWLPLLRIPSFVTRTLVY